MRQDTNNHSWKASLFLISVTAAVTAGLMTLYNRYQDSKKPKDVHTKQDAMTQTDPVHAHQNRPAARPLQAPCVTTAARGGFFHIILMRNKHVLTFEEELLQRYINELPTQPNTSAKPDVVVPIAQSETIETLHTKSSRPPSPHNELPGEGTAGLFGSRDSSYAVLPSRAASVDDDLDKPRPITPNNSQEPLKEDIQRRHNELLAQVEEDRASSVEKNTVTQERKGWLSNLLSWR